MPEGQVLEFTHVTKRFNEVTAVSDFSARVEPGAVTAFLGPNGAGKTTTLRILLGQVRATSGTATIGGTAYAELRQPLRTIGAVLEETVYRPRRTAERQLTIAAKANGIPLARVGEVLSLVGLEGEGDSRIGGFSLGMRQRLSVAHALLGDPGALVFDEPANGLDPEGIRWMRLLMRRLADEGRTVLVSSHVLSEVEQVADNVLVLSKGTLVLASGIETLADPKGGSVVVDAADRAGLTSALAAAGFDIEVLRSGLTVRGGDAETVGAVAADAGIALSTLVQRGPTLEDVFIDLMRGGRFVPNAPVNSPQPLAATPAGSAPTSADSVVAIPVAAAAAWAAEAASAPEGEAVADDLAASVSTGDDESERRTDGPDAPSDDADAAPQEAPADADADADAAHSDADATAADSAEADSADTDSAEADSAEADSADTISAEAAQSDGGQSDDEQSHGAQEDAAAAFEEAPARSFDEILFGAAAPAESDDAPSVDLTTGDEHPSGVEVFADLHDASDATDATGSDDEDPRSAAVSSMLAAAARAYYEDEPKDYPLSAENETAVEENAEGGPSEEGAHWTVASTGVIDTVPAAEASDAGEESDTEASDTEAADTEASDTEAADTEASDTEAADTEASDTEAADTEASDTGEHRHDGEHHHG